MGFLGSSVVVVGIAVVSACLGLLGFVVLHLDLDTSAILALAVFAVLMLVQFTAWRRHDRQAQTEGLRELREALARIDADLSILTNRTAALETAGAGTLRREIDELADGADQLRADLNDTMALLAEVSEVVTSLQAGVPAPPADTTVPATKTGEDPRPAGRFMALSKVERVALLAGALDANRLDILLQPVVTLPQRKIRWYEVHIRLRTEKGDVLLPEDAAAIAAEGGLSSQLDRTVLLRAVQLIRRLQARNREVGLMVPVSQDALLDGEQFRDVVDYIAENKTLAPSLLVQIRQDAYRTFGALELESLAALARHGVRFVVEDARDLRFDPRELADRGARFVKVPADVLLGRAGELPLDIHAADLAGLLARYGIDMIASRIETESTVLELLDYEVRYGQGFLFSPPRPVRADILGAEPSPERRAALV